MWEKLSKPKNTLRSYSFCHAKHFVILCKRHTTATVSFQITAYIDNKLVSHNEYDCNWYDLC